VKGRGSRTITLNVHEARLIRARAEALPPAVKRKLRRRAVVERKIDHLQDLGAKKARYRGRRKTKLQAFLAATVANLTRLDLLGAFQPTEVVLGPCGSEALAEHTSAREKLHFLLTHLEGVLRPPLAGHRG